MCNYLRKMTDQKVLWPSRGGSSDSECNRVVVRSRLVGQRTAVIDQIRTFLLEQGAAARQGLGALRQALPSMLAQRTDVLSPRI